MSNGDSAGSGIPILGPILDALSGLLGGAQQVQDLARAVGQVEQAAWSNTINLATWSFGLFGGILTSLHDLIGKLGKALEDLFTKTIWGYIKSLFQHIKDWITKLRNWIKVHVAALQQIQKQLDKARAQQMRLVLDVIQRIRKILVPFRLLHLGFATKIDATLARYESDLGAKWAKLIAFNTQVLGVLNDVLDPRNLMRPGHVLGSLGMMVGAVHGAIGAADVRTLLCMGPAVVGQPLSEPWIAYQVQVTTDLRNRTGDYALMLDARAQLDQSIANEIGGPTG